jgi:LAO/AO transport system kinase
MTVLLDAAGKDVVLVETVGVGQDEVEIARLADVTVVVLVPGMGDDVQAIKAGIMEIADVFVINKSDQPGADQLEREIKAIQSLSTRKDGWVPPIVRTVASDGLGIAEALTAVRSFLERGGGKDRAIENWSMRLREMLRERLLERFADVDFQAAAQDIVARRSDPYTIIHAWLKRNAN